MAKITMTIKDVEDGKVSVVFDPTIMAILHMDENDHKSSHGMAIKIANFIRKMDQEEKKRQRNGASEIWTPSAR